MRQKQAYPGTLASYTVGFINSLLLTLTVYFIVTTDRLDDTLTVVAVIGLAVLQFIVQLIFFLHMGRETKPRWNLVAFIFMVIMIAIIVVGSLWIMNNLNYNMMMSPEEMDQYMLDQSKKGF